MWKLDFPFLDFGHGEFFARCLDEFREIVVVIYFGDIEVVLRAVVRRTHVNGAQQSPPCFCWLQIKAVITYQPENLSVTIDAIVAKHLLGDYLARPTALVGDVLHKITTACHDYPISASA